MASPPLGEGPLEPVCALRRPVAGTLSDARMRESYREGTDPPHITLWRASVPDLECVRTCSAPA